MADQFVSRVIAFRGEEEYIRATEVLTEVTEVEGDRVEVALTLPAPGKTRIYVAFSLSELIHQALAGKK